jgi:hypothetical protein
MGETHAGYLGDGVYVTFDGYNIWLRTQRGFDMHEISLEPETMRNLLDYAVKIDPRFLGEYKK